jgi:hypothetical protein
VAYLTYADLRPSSAAEFATGLTLSDSDVGDDALITAAIARMSLRFDDLTNDHFETQTGVTLTLAGYGDTILYLPRRTTAVTTVSVTNYLGVTTAQAATVYRLHSSLNSAGSAWNSPGDLDWLELLPYQFLSGASFGLGYAWPTESNSVTVLGTFGWTVTPFDVKNAVAMMVYDHFKNKSDRIRRASSYQAGDASFVNNETGTGIKDVDDIVERYRRTQSVMVG